MTRKINFILSLMVAFRVQTAMATKPCTNVSHCGNCALEADIVAIGSIVDYRSELPGNIIQTFKILFERFEKGKFEDLKSVAFETGCWSQDDLSVYNGIDLKATRTYRFYLQKSKKEKSGFKVIEFQKLK